MIPFELMSLPSPVVDQAYCNISALEAENIGLPLKVYIDTPANQVLLAPSLSFLIQHVKRPEKLVFDLVIRRDWLNLPPQAIAIDYENNFDLRVQQDIVDSLAKGGLEPTDINTVCLSHCHFDHVGDHKLFPTGTFMVGAAAAELFEPGYPTNPTSSFSSDLLPHDRTLYLKSDGWKPIGPFPHGLDFYGDGSLYIVDSLGHHPGHLNILARTSSDGVWLLLAGDSAHHWSILTGESEIATAHGCAHVDKEAAERHIARIQDLMKQPRVRILLAHDDPWYKENKEGSSFFPGKIASL
ncbi:hypothetical protein H0H81_005820 [Sphagnurus paluster]|uniref:Metallo-beta-lactamase domain-containing protein n=1 Tax=Sphagnurus paluster TaxID=117069 RepID=A0A9P7FXV9_9AGAR|nr:hypothetical protein H0H81_005820 [Sphagnurus paluster]